MRTRAERRAQKKQWELQLNHQLYLRSPRYMLEQAAAQLAISLARDMTVGSSLQARINIAGDDVEHPQELLSEVELQFLPQANFVVDAIKAAMDSSYEPKGHWVQNIGYYLPHKSKTT
jgi:hypothetical protein